MTAEPVVDVIASYPGWYFWLLFGLAMLVSSIGFKNYVWFISLGYGFSIAAAGLLMLADGLISLTAAVRIRWRLQRKKRRA